MGQEEVQRSCMCKRPGTGGVGRRKEELGALISALWRTRDRMVGHEGLGGCRGRTHMHTTVRAGARVQNAGWISPTSATEAIALCTPNVSPWGRWVGSSTVAACRPPGIAVPGVRVARSAARGALAATTSTDGALTLRTSAFKYRK